MGCGCEGPYRHAETTPEVDHAVIIGWSPDQRPVRDVDTYALVSDSDPARDQGRRGSVVTEWSRFSEEPHQTPHAWASNGRASGGLELEAGRVLEDAVIGDEGDAEAQGGRRDPSVGVVFPLAQGMPDALAGDAELGVDADQITS